MPAGIRACLFDLDGVLTQTDLVHTAAWQEMFDTFLRKRATRTGQPFIPFDPVSDYGRYVDGKPRADGARSFLASRGIELPEGGDEDEPGAETVRALSDTKNAILLRRIDQDGVQAYPGSVRYLRAVLAAGRQCAVVSASANCRAVLAAAGLIDDFQVVVDAAVTDRERLRGKPAPTPTWPPPGCLASRPRRPPCTRTRRPEWPRGVRAASAGWSEWTAWARRTPSGGRGLTSSSTISPNSPAPSDSSADWLSS